jgi:hypothetical protein
MRKETVEIVYVLQFIHHESKGLSVSNVPELIDCDENNKNVQMTSLHNVQPSYDCIQTLQWCAILMLLDLPR